MKRNEKGFPVYDHPYKVQIIDHTGIRQTWGPIRNPLEIPDKGVLEDAIMNFEPPLPESSVPTPDLSVVDDDADLNDIDLNLDLSDLEED